MADRGYRSLNFDTRDTSLFLLLHYTCKYGKKVIFSAEFYVNFWRKKSLIIKNKNILLNASLASIWSLYLNIWILNKKNYEAGLVNRTMPPYVQLKEP